MRFGFSRCGALRSRKGRSFKAKADQIVNPSLVDIKIRQKLISVVCLQVYSLYLENSPFYYNCSTRLSKILRSFIYDHSIRKTESSQLIFHPANDNVMVVREYCSLEQTMTDFSITNFHILKIKSYSQN